MSRDDGEGLMKTETGNLIIETEREAAAGTKKEREGRTRTKSVTEAEADTDTYVRTKPAAETETGRAAGADAEGIAGAARSQRLVGLPAQIDHSCRILLLGSMPGEASLNSGQYYGHPRNMLWRLLYSLLDGGEPAVDYAARLQFVLSRGVALWDVLHACERVGSLDAAIRRPEANDLAGLFMRFPNIRYVFFNGSASAELYRKQVLKQLPAAEAERLVYDTLPSSSPARAMSFEAKLEAWQPVRKAWLAAGHRQQEG